MTDDEETERLIARSARILALTEIDQLLRDRGAAVTLQYISTELAALRQPNAAEPGSPIRTEFLG
jgi:hypothetical protein